MTFGIAAELNQASQPFPEHEDESDIQAREPTSEPQALA